MPKLRGYSFKGFQGKFVVVNVGQLEVAFSNNDSVSPKIMVKLGMLETRLGKNPKVKILALGDISKKLNISGCSVSAEAKAKIEKKEEIMPAKTAEKPITPRLTLQQLINEAGKNIKIIDEKLEKQEKKIQEAIAKSQPPAPKPDKKALAEEKRQKQLELKKQQAMDKQLAAAERKKKK